MHWQINNTRIVKATLQKILLKSFPKPDNPKIIYTEIFIIKHSMMFVLSELQTVDTIKPKHLK